MAFVVQNDQGNAAGANAYCDVDFFRAYFESVGTDTTSYSDTQVEQAIVAGTRYLDSRFRFPGETRNSRQPTKWPRWGVYDASGDRVSGVPKEIKEATCEAAMRKLSGVSLLPDPTYDPTGQTVESKSVKVGPITESYTYSIAPGTGGVKLPDFPAIRMLLTTSGLITSGFSIPMERG